MRAVPISAARDLLDRVERSDLPANGVRVGVGIDRGSAFVGVLGLDEKLDFTALGDTVNTAARLGSAAGPGHVLLTERAWTVSGFDAVPASTAPLVVAGKAEPVAVVDLGPDGARVGRLALRDLGRTREQGQLQVAGSRQPRVVAAPRRARRVRDQRRAGIDQHPRRRGGVSHLERDPDVTRDPTPNLDPDR